MSIFRRDPDPSPSPSPAKPRMTPSRPSTTKAASPEATRIATGTRVVGEVSGSADLIVEGELEGSVRLDSQVIVGAKGRIEGNIEASSIQLGGKVVGNIRGRERVEVQPSGKLEGDVTSPSVVLQEGAVVNGKIEMTGGSGKQQSSAKGADKSRAGASGKERSSGSRDEGRQGGHRQEGRGGAGHRGAPGQPGSGKGHESSKGRSRR